MFKNACRPEKTDPVERVLVLSLPPPSPPRKTIHNLPKTPPPQDLLITMGQDYPHNGPGLPVHPTQSGGQPSHLPLLPRIDVKRPTRRQNP